MANPLLKASFAIVRNGIYWRIPSTLTFGITWHPLSVLQPIMARAKKKPKKKVASQARSPSLPAETKGSETLTVFWTLTVLMVLMTNLATVAVHYYLLAHPEAEKLALLKGLLLFSGALVGGVSLIVLPILYRVRKQAPPPGLAVFGTCVAVAPILVVLVGVFS